MFEPCQLVNGAEPGFGRLEVFLGTEELSLAVGRALHDEALRRAELLLRRQEVVAVDNSLRVRETRRLDLFVLRRRQKPVLQTQFFVVMLLAGRDRDRRHVGLLLGGPLCRLCAAEYRLRLSRTLVQVREQRLDLALPHI